MLTDVDLPAPGLLWTRWVTLSATCAAIGRTGTWSIDGRGAGRDHHDGSWARFALLDGRRAVLYGHDREHSATSRADPPLDLLAGAPDWLPWNALSPLAARGRLGFVIWHDNGRWSRVRYHGDLTDGATDRADGMPGLVGPLLTTESTLLALARLGPRTAAERLLAAAVRTEVTDGHFADLLTDGTADRLTGEAADRLTGETTDRMTGETAEHPTGETTDRMTGETAEHPTGKAVDLGAAMATATRGGLVPGSSPPRIEPGRRPPMRRVRRLSQNEHDRLVWATMRDSPELSRPAPPATAELDDLVAWLQARAPRGDGRCTLLAYADATSFSAQPGERSPTDRPDEERYAAFRRLTELVRALRRAESDPRHGRWLFLRVETSATGVRVERRYDSWPLWWHDDGVSGPWRTNLREEMDARSPAYRPSWVNVLDPEVAYRPL